MAPRSAQVVILGAGRSMRGGGPSAMVDIDEHGRVMDWLLDAFAVLGEPEIYFVGGFKAQDVVERYPQLRVVFNRRWAETGPVESLALVPLDPLRPAYVCYSDVVFRRSAVEQLAAVPEGMAIAVDSRWRQRYDGRHPRDFERAEKVRTAAGALVEIGSGVDVAAADAEFAGLLRLSPHAVAAALRSLHGIEWEPTAALPTLIESIRSLGVAAHTVDLEGGWAELDARQDLARFVLGTKAESLERLAPMDHGATIGALVSFTRAAWVADREMVLERIGVELAGGALIVRSSALNEDGWGSSGAGRHESIADVPPDREPLTDAIELVFASYGPDAASSVAGHHDQDADQVLVQHMVRDVVMSGVVMTRTHALGAPYYVVNFDDASSRTDVVTGGGDARTIVCLRGAEVAPSVPPEISSVLSAVQKIEGLVGHDSLDIEFAVTASGDVNILQVRPIATSGRPAPMDDDAVEAAVLAGTEFVEARRDPSPTLVGRTTRYSVMADWNPAEIVGITPRPLALSLYRWLITDDVWAQQRAEYGYRDVRPCPLIVEIAGHPYVDVRACFNSFVPAALSDEFATRLVEYQLEGLAADPTAHDKVEFDIVTTCLAPGFGRTETELRADGFSAPDVEALRDSLRAITANAMDRLSGDLHRLELVRDQFSEQLPRSLRPLDAAAYQLERVRRVGTPLFAHLARSAFVASTIMRGLVESGAITQPRLDEYLATIETVFGRLQADAARVRRGALDWNEFVDEYGHLRPGTYDITSPSYRQVPEEYLRPLVTTAAHRTSPPDFAWTENERGAMATAMGRLGLDDDPDHLDHFVRGAIAGREAGKFVFTRPLSGALELIAAYGESLGISRDDLSNVRIADLLAARDAIGDPVGYLRRRIEEGVETHQVTQGVALPGQIADPVDLKCFEQVSAEPNFVTRLVVEAPTVAGTIAPTAEVAGRIVLIPSADPGYDWLLARDIAGLITMFGGANSHMAVRAAECSLPAAIGIGEHRYATLANAAVVRIDCGARTLSVVR